MEDIYYPIEFNGDSFNIYNNGTAPAPCVVTFVPQVDFVNFVIEGLSAEPISISNILRNQVLVIDGEQKKVTINDVDVIDRYNGWEFPKLQPGLNTIRVANGSLSSLAIAYNARYI